MKCSECEYSNYLLGLKGYTCSYPESKVILFKGKTKPHDCPLIGSKGYVVHGNCTPLTILVTGYHR